MSVFTIDEAGYERTKVELTGYALPIGTFILDGSQRVKKCASPGSPVASAQVLGPDEGGTTVSGKWVDRYLGDTLTQPAKVNALHVPTAKKLADAVDTIRLGGREVLVTWFEFARRGIVTRFTQRWHSQWEVEWELEFVWLSQDEEPVETVIEAEADQTQLLTKVDPTAVEAATDALTKYQDVADTALAGAQAARSYYDKVEDVFGAASYGVTTPLEAAKAAAAYGDAIAVSAVETAQTLAPRASLAVERLGADALVAATPGSSTPETEGGAGSGVVGVPGSTYLTGARLITPLGMLSSESRSVALALVGARCRVATAEMRRLARSGASLAAILVRREGGRPSVQVHRARRDEDVQRIAEMYYGDRSLWRALQRYNGLENSELEAGQVVFVPPSGSLT